MELPDLDYRGLFDASPNPYLVLDRALNIVVANKAYLASTKRDLADIVGRWAWDAFPTDPVTLKQSVDSFERVIRTRQPDTMALLRFDIPRPDAAGGGFETRYWSITHTPVLDENGEVALVLQHPIDVTELERLRDTVRTMDDATEFNLVPAQTGIFERAQSVFEANLALKEASDRLREMFEMAPSPIVVLRGRDHVFELANEAYFQLVGRRDIIGKPMLEAVPELAGQGFETLMDHVLETGKPYVGRGLKASVQQEPGGPLVDIYFDVLYQPLFGSGASVSGIFCQLNDVTDAYRAQAQLQESQERLQDGMDAARMVVWDWDVPSGRMTLSENASRILGCRSDSWELLFPHVHPGDQRRVQETRRRATPEDPRYSMEFRFIRPDTGTTIWLEVRAHVVFDPDGSPCMVKGVALDITERKHTEEQLRAQTDKLQIAKEAAELGLFDYNFLTLHLESSERAAEHFGVPGTLVSTRESLLKCVHPEDREPLQRALEDAFSTGGSGRYQVEFRTLDASGNQRWIAATGKVLNDTRGRPIRTIGTTMDISERKRAERQLQQAAQHDSLTGLPNRALLADYCSHVLAMAQRTGEPGALLFIDLDRFKPINDMYGHDVGDKVLQEVARRLQSCTRKEDIVSRLGGDEFIVVLPRIDSQHDPETVAQHILQAIDQPIYVDVQQLNVSPSIGVSLFPQHGQDLEQLIRCADMAMYAAKKAGRNNFKTYSPGLDEQASDLLRLEIQLKQCLASRGFALFYQPIIDIRSRKLVGAEALIRMPSHDGRLLNPAEFIPVAESAGLIGDVGEWVVREACRQHRAWSETGLHELTIAINVSAIQFRQSTLTSMLAEAIHDSCMDPVCLQIEVTESAVMDNIPEAVEKIQELRSMGIRISLDDFGTGYSSLSYLSSLPLDKLKIDQSFIREMARSQRSRSITEAIIGLGRTLNLKVVGEGIESEESMEYLHRFGCDQAQGYLFSAPLPAREFESWCRQR